MNRVIEIRTLRLKQGARPAFEAVFIGRVLPLLRRWKTDLVAYGPSLHNEHTYYVIRSYASVEDRKRSHAAFYNSDDWLLGPREDIWASLEGYADAVLEVDEMALNGLRMAKGIE
jgi:NIPSNAP